MHLLSAAFFFFSQLPNVSSSQDLSVLTTVSSLLNWGPSSGCLWCPMRPSFMLTPLFAARGRSKAKCDKQLCVTIASCSAHLSPSLRRLLGAWCARAPSGAGMPRGTGVPWPMEAAVWKGRHGSRAPMQSGRSCTGSAGGHAQGLRLVPGALPGRSGPVGEVGTCWGGQGWLPRENDPRAEVWHKAEKTCSELRGQGLRQKQRNEYIGYQLLGPLRAVRILGRASPSYKIV